MPLWAVGILGLAAALFLVKAVLVASIVLVLPSTGGAMYVPTPNRRVRAFLESVPMGPETLFVDLGCGDGRVIGKAHALTNVRAMGYELNLLAYLMARIRCRNMPKVSIHRKNFFQADLAKADIVFFYLFPDVLEALAIKLKKELRPGTLVASCNFPVPGWTPDTVLRPGSGRHSDPIYLYRIQEGA